MKHYKLFLNLNKVKEQCCLCRTIWMCYCEILKAWALYSSQIPPPDMSVGFLPHCSATRWRMLKCMIHNTMTKHTALAEHVWMSSGAIQFHTLHTFHWLYLLMPFFLFPWKVVVTYSVHLRTCVCVCMNVSSDVFHLLGSSDWRMFSGWMGGGWHEVRAEGNQQCHLPFRLAVQAWCRTCG